MILVFRLVPTEIVAASTRHVTCAFCAVHSSVDRPPPSTVTRDAPCPSVLARSVALPVSDIAVATPLTRDRQPPTPCPAG